MDSAVEFHYAAKRGTKFAVKLGELILTPANLEYQGIKVGGMYEHESGDVYWVIGFSNLNATNPNFVPTVIYSTLSHGDREVWSRPVDEFLKKFKYGG